MAQQRSQQGMSNLVGAGTTLGLGALQNRKKKNTTDPNDTTLDSTSFQIPGLGEGANAAYNALNYQFGQGLNENPFAGPSLRPGLMGTTRIPRVDTEEETNSQEQGGVVQKTPGEFDHDTNDMILMAPTADGLVDTGIRQTGGEFVLNPEQAEGLEDAYDAVDPRNPTFDQLLALYEAARFLEEPQFDDDYAA